jgi:hypothetical protein
MSTLLLTEFIPVDSGIRNETYASSLARSTLLTLQSAIVEGVGGVEYELDGLGYLSSVGGETRRTLKYKTFAELMSEDAFLNLQAEILDGKLELRAIQEFDENLRGGLKLLLDRIFGGRFGYRLCARTMPPELDPTRQGFEIIVEDYDDSERMLCSETLTLPLPAFGEQPLNNTSDGVAFESGVVPVLEVTLELWSK